MMRNRMATLELIVLMVLSSTAMAWDGLPLHLPSCEHKHIFVTSETFNGNLGGLSGADAICRRLAKAAHLKGQYKAWLSSGTAEESATERLAHSTVPYADTCFPDHEIADGWISLVSGTLRYPITCDERSRPVESHWVVWTGTNTWAFADDPVGGDDGYCQQWRFSGENVFAVTGMTHTTDYLWTGAAAEGPLACGKDGCHRTPCIGSCRLYCIEQ